MAAIDFPNAPTLNQLYSAPNGVVYKWNGALWLAGPTSGGVTAPTYDSLAVVLTDSTLFAGASADVIMQITNGTQMFSRVFTALDATHPIAVDVTAMIGGGGNQWVAVGLFIDGVAAAVDQKTIYIPTAGSMYPARLYWQGVLAAGPHTFAVRFGGVGTTYTQASQGSRIGGGQQHSTMTINEIGVGPQGPQGPPGPTGGPVTAPLFVVNAAVVNDPGTYALPNADAVMQITQGTQIFSQSFTCVDPTHPIEVDCYALLGTTNSAWAGMGLFIDGVAAAVRTVNNVTNTFPMPFVLKWSGVLAAGPHTFSVRFGAGGNVWINANSAVRVGGGAQAAWLKITEVGVGPVGPQGAMGPTGAGSAWGTIATFNLAAPQALIVSDGWQAAGWKDIHIMAQLLPTTNNVNPLMQFRKGGATLVDAGYGFAAVTCSETGASSYVGGAGTTSLLSALVGGIGNLAGLSLDMRIPNIASLTPIRGVFQIGLDSQGGGGTGYHYQGGCRYATLASLPIDGISFGFSAGNIAAGSRMIVMGTK